MGNRKLCGFDVNGWRDGVARNWVARPGDEEEIGVVRVVEGAVLPEVVRVGTGKDSRWIGGAQADLAPHGRGGGWGEIGKPERRLAVSSLIHADRTVPAVLAAAFSGLAQGASHSVAAIEDSERTTEPMQERLFGALSSARAGKSLLVWRSVLSVLHALEDRALQGAAREGAVIGVVGHVGAGFSVQTLRVRAESRGGDLLLAPERRQVGRLVASSLGYEGLVSMAMKQVMALAPYSRADHFLSARSIGRLAFGLPTAPEPLRRANGDWDILTPPQDLDVFPPSADDALQSALPACDLILFESLTEGVVRRAVLGHVRSALSGPVTALPATAVAKGALIAAERHAAGRTVYFDFLPRIATIVQGQDGAMSYDLIDAAETLPAGSVYRSPRPARFALEAGKDRFQVYLRKETHHAPRKAVIEVGTQSQQAAPVDLWVEQMPAAGRAKILMQAPTLSRQFTVDWDAAEVQDRTWQDILDDLATPPPSIPQRLVLRCGMRAWQDSPRGPGLLTLLQDNARRRAPDWDDLAKKLMARPFGEYCISSDGAVPTGVPGDAIEQLSELTDRALKALQRMERGDLPADTAPLRFLTWQFRRCPAPVVPMLLDAWKARAAGRAHPFATSSAAWVLIRQGLGRVVSEPEQEKQAMDLLLEIPIESWSWREETAAAAFLLSRSDSCPTVLDRNAVDRLGRRVIRELEDSVGSEFTTFQYAPFLLVGLLRWRLKVPRALVEGTDPLASRLAQTVRRVQADMKRRARQGQKLQRVVDRWLPLLSDTLEELGGVGGNPDLLSAIYDG